MLGRTKKSRRHTIHGGTCPECGGGGRVPDRRYPYGLWMIPCPQCGGTGQIQ